MVFVAVALALWMPANARAACDQISILSFDRGYYDATGYGTSDQTYLCGQLYTLPVRRNWAVFSIPVLTQQVVSASLRVYSGYMASPTASETFQLRHVSTSVPSLRARGFNHVAIYADLGEGDILGKRSFAYTDPHEVLIPLSAAFVSNLVASSGGAIAIGGEITTLSGSIPNYEYVFEGGSSANGVNATNDTQLVLTFAGPEPIVITEQPASQSVNALANAQFYGGVCGSSVLNFQWQRDGTNLPGANTALLSLPSVTTNDAGAYRLIATNLSGAVTSAVANLSVIYQLPAATVTVLNATSPYFISNNLTICSTVSGIPTPTVQWQHNGTNLPGAVSGCLYFYNIQTNDGGDYTIIASNIVGVVTSAVVSIVLTTPPPVYISGSPTQTFTIGYSVYLCGNVNTAPFPTFRWLHNGVDIPGETSQCFYRQFTSTNDAGIYSIVVSNISGAYTSAPVDVVLYYQAPGPPYMYFSEGGSAGLLGNNVTLCSSAGGSPPLTYQWRLNGTNLAEQAAQCLTLLGLEPNDAGAYTVVVSNYLGSVTSEPINITVTSQAPVFNAVPYNQSVAEGATVRIWGNSLAGPPATHFLELNGTNLAVPYSYDNSGFGGFTLLDVNLADAGQYRVIASNSFGVVTSVVATLTIRPAEALDRWTQRNPLPQSQSLFSITYGNGLFVGVGDHGTILTSSDGTNWFVQSRRVDLSLRGVTFGNGVFVTVGQAGTILSSLDGTNWQYRYSSSAAFLNAVTYGNGRFVAVGSGPPPTVMVTSTDGSMWERVSSVPNFVESGIAFGNGVFVAVGSANIATSADGLDWTTSLGPVPNKVESVSFIQNQFIAVGDNGTMYVAPDGWSWSARNSSTTRRLRGVTYGNGRYVAAGVRGTIVTSTDANAWTGASSGTPDRLETVRFANGVFVSAGENGTTITSTNGTTWTKQNRGITRDLDGMAVANGKIVIVGKGGSILISTNGTDYTDHNAGVTNDLHGIAWANGLWVAVGEPNMIVTSSNALNWTGIPLGGSNSLKGVTFANEKWIAVGTKGTIASSVNGTDWSVTTTTPPFDLNDVAYGGGIFVIAADGPFNQDGSCFVSSDGVSWSWLNSAYFGKNLRSILFTNGVFLATANDGLVYYTSNVFFTGFNWIPRATDIGQNLRGACFADGLWFVVGNNGKIASSSNLIDWVARPTRTFENLHDIAFLDGKLVTMGNRGTVLQSERFGSSFELTLPRYQPGIGATIGIKAVFGRQYQLQASPNLLQWTNIFRFTNNAETSTFIDTNAAVLPRRFYRLFAE